MLVEMVLLLLPRRKKNCYPTAEHLQTAVRTDLIDAGRGRWEFGQKELTVKSKKYDDKPDHDALKKAGTDALTKCLSYLGFNADIFMGKFDDNKYVAEMDEK